MKINFGFCSVPDRIKDNLTVRSIGKILYIRSVRIRKFTVCRKCPACELTACFCKGIRGKRKLFIINSRRCRHVSRSAVCVIFYRIGYRLPNGIQNNVLCADENILSARILRISRIRRFRPAAECVAVSQRQIRFDACRISVCVSTHINRRIYTSVSVVYYIHSRYIGNNNRCIFLYLKFIFSVYRLCQNTVYIHLRRRTADSKFGIFAERITACIDTQSRIAVCRKHADRV